MTGSKVFDLFGDLDRNGEVITMMNYKDNKTNARRHERHQVPVVAWLEFYGDDDSRGTVSRDVSAEGARFSGLRPAMVGEPVIVRMQLGRTSTIVECKGRIMWTKLMPNRLHDFGVRFLDLSEEEQSDLLGFLTGHFETAAYAAV